jgi:hypothetical protein
MQAGAVYKQVLCTNLISRVTHLVFSAQVDPQLQAMSSAVTKWHLQHQRQHSTAVIGSSVLCEVLAQQ